MSDLIQLTEAEITAVAGGTQSITISSTQSSFSTVVQTSTSSNSGAVMARVTGNGAIAAHGVVFELSVLSPGRIVQEITADAGNAALRALAYINI